MFDLVTFTMYCQPLLERSPGNQMALVAAALLMSDDKDTVSDTGLCSEYWRDTPCSTRKKYFYQHGARFNTTRGCPEVVG